MQPSYSIPTKFSTCRPPGYQPTRVVQPGKEPFEDPVPLMPTQSQAILHGRSNAVVAMQRDELDAEVRGELRIQHVAVVGAVPNQARRIVREEPVLERGGDEPNFIW